MKRKTKELMQKILVIGLIVLLLFPMPVTAEGIKQLTEGEQSKQDNTIELNEEEVIEESEESGQETEESEESGQETEESEESGQEEDGSKNENEIDGNTEKITKDKEEEHLEEVLEEKDNEESESNHSDNESTKESKDNVEVIDDNEDIISNKDNEEKEAILNNIKERMRSYTEPASISILSADIPYTEVTTAAQLKNIRLNPSGNYRLMRNINLGPPAAFTIDGKFTGRFDGNGYTISNGKAALFEEIGSSAHVRNVRLLNFNTNSIGILAEMISGNALVERVSVEGGIASNWYAGGIAGGATGNSIVKDSFSNTTVRGMEAGGILAFIGDRAKVINSLSLSTLDGDYNGGIVSSPQAGWKDDSQSNTELSNVFSGSGSQNDIGWHLSPTLLKDMSYYRPNRSPTPWDFNRIWRMDATLGYPVLKFISSGAPGLVTGYDSDRNNYKKRHDIDLSINGTGIGFKQLQYRWSTSSTFPTSGWSTLTYNDNIFHHSENYLSPTTTGTHYFHARITDNRNNTRTTTSVGLKVDNTFPVVSLSTNGNLTYARSHSATTINASDAHSGLDTVQYRWTTSTITPTSGWITGANGTTTSAPTETGNQYLHVRATDKAGNVRNFRSNMFRIDRTTPSVSLSQNGGGYARSHSTTINASDGHSGLNTVQYQWTTSTTTPTSGWTTGANGTTTSAPTSTGNKYLHVRATDKAGNVRNFTSSVFRIDRTLPTVSLSKNGGGHATSHSTTITASDSHSGLNTVQYRWTTTSTFPTSGWTTGANGTTTSAPTSTGNKYLHVRATDNAGNVSNFTSSAFQIDRTNPTAPTITAASGWQKANVSVTIAPGTDGNSGVARTEYRLGTSGSWTTYSNAVTVSTNGSTTVQARTIDNAGNISSTASRTVQVDKTLPSLSLTQTPTGATRGEVTITATGSDTHSGVKRIRQGTGSWVNASSMTFTTAANGTYSFTVEDNAGNTRTSSIVVSNIDTAPPTHVSTSISGERYKSGSTYWVRPSDVLTITHRQRDTGSGNARGYLRVTGNSQDVRYFHNFTGTTTNMTPVNSSFVNTSSVEVQSVSRTEHNTSTGYSSAAWKTRLLTSGHTYNLQYYYSDIAGNVVGYITSATARVDGVAPTMTITQSPTGATNGNVTLTANGSDALSGVKRIRLPNGTWVNGSTASQTVSSNGTYSFQVEDNVGLQRTQSITVSNIDKTLPTVSLSKNGGGYATSHSTTINASDTGGSSLNTVQYQWTTSTTFPTSGWTTGANGTTTSAPTTTGNKYLHVRATDKAGNVRNFTSSVFRIDRTNPTAPTITAASGWQKANVSVTVASGTDAHSGVARTEYRLGTSGSWITYSNAVTVSTNGSTTVQARTIDNAGNISTVASRVVQIDKTLPTVSLSKNGGGYATSHSATINASDSGGSALNTVQYRWTTNTTFPTSGWTTGANGTVANAPASTGNHYLHVRATDGAGNVSNFTSAVFRIDRTAPTQPVITANSGWQTANQSVTVTPGTDGHSGVSRTEYRIGSGSWTTYSSAFTVSTNGSTTVQARTIDSVGNTSAVRSATIQIDKINPTLSLTQNTSAATNGNVIITATGSDSHSGVKRVRQGAGSWVNSSSMTFTATANGTYSFTVEDNAGRTGTASITISNIDKTLPTVSLSKNGGAWATAHSTSINASDTGGSGLSTVQYVWSTSTTTPTSGWINGSNGTATSAPASTGNHYLHVRATDGAGNTRNFTSSAFQIDRTNPTAPTITAASGWQKANVSVTIASGTDGNSGVARTEYRLGTSGSWITYSNAVTVSTNGTTTVQARTIDNAGNSSAVASRTVQLDKTLPTVSLSQNGGAWATAHSTTINASDAGGSGLSTVQYAWTTSSTTPTTGWLNGSNGTATSAPTTSGTHYLHVRATDGAGNVRNFTSSVFRIDRTNPSQPTITAASGWQKANVSVTVDNGTDGHSGVARTEYRIGSGAWTTYSNAVTVSTNGTTTVQARTFDNVGNVSGTTSRTIQIDKVAPSLTLTQTPTGSTSGNVTITATGSDSHSGVKRIRQGTGTWTNSSSMTFTAASNTTYSFTVEDNAGNTTTESITVNNIDKTLPTVSLSKNGGTWATAHSTSINASDTGGSGLSTVQYQWTTSATFPSSGWLNGNNGTATSAPTSTGSHYLHVKATDGAGNVRNFTSAVFQIDNTNPTAPTITAASGWQTSNQSVTITPGTDGHSGIARTEYRLGTSGNWLIYNEAITISTNGSTTIQSRAIDRAGNISSTSTATIQIDKTNPTLTLTQNTSAATNGNVIITATGSDAHSGVKRIRQGTGSWVNSGNMTFTATANGTYSFTVEDNAGRTGTASITISNIDKTLPTVSLSKNGGTWAKAHSTTINASDSGGSGLNTVQYVWSTSTTAPSTGWTSITAGGSVSAPTTTGTHYLHVIATDNAGNLRNFMSNKFEIDNTSPAAPTITAASGWQKANISVTISSGTDAHSGVARSQYRLNNGTWTNYTDPVTVSTNGTSTVEARTLDNAGNISTVVSRTVQLDKVDPLLSIVASTTQLTNQDVVLTATGVDADSGVKRIKLPNGTWVTGSTATQTVSSNGEYTFTVEDNAGNSKEEVFEVTNIDKVKPTLTITPNTTDTTHEDVVLTITAKDNLSGIKNIQLPDGSLITNPSTTFNVKENGTYSFTVEDNAGNKHTQSITISNIDKTMKIDWPTVSNLTSITLSGGDNISNANITPLRMKDWREGNNSWRVNVSSTQLKMKDGTSLPKGAVTLSPPTVTRVEGTGTIPTRSMSSERAIDNGVVELVRSVNARGEYLISFPTNALKVSVDPTTKIGTYEATITWDIVTGP